MIYKVIVVCNFVGSSNCFLFSIKPFCEVYTATGYNENFMYLNQGVQTLPNGLVSTTCPDRAGKYFIPFKPNGISPLLSIGPVHFCFKGCWVMFFMLIQILIEHYVS